MFRKIFVLTRRYKYMLCLLILLLLVLYHKPRSSLARESLGYYQPISIPVSQYLECVPIDTPFAQYTKEIISARVEFVKNMSAASPRVIKFRLPIQRSDVISARNDTDYMTNIGKIGGVVTIMHKCDLNPLVSDNTTCCSVPLPPVLYKWTVNESLCQIVHQFVPDDCKEHVGIKNAFQIIQTPHYYTKIHPGVAATNVYMHIIQNGVIDHNGNVGVKGKVIMPHSCQKFYSNNIMSRGNRKYLLPVDEVFVIGQFWGHGFYHVTVEILTRLIAYLDFLKTNTQIKIHVKQITSMYHKYFRIFGLDPKRMIFGNITGKVVYLPQGGGCGEIVAPLGTTVADVFHKYTSRLKPVKSRNKETGKLVLGASKIKHRNTVTYVTLNPLPSITKRNALIFIHRTATFRKLTQHEEIVPLLKSIADEYQLTYVTYSDTDLPAFEDTLRLFYNAVLIVAPHGAGLSNMMFSQPGTMILEVICRYSVNMCYQKLAYNLGMVYHGLVSELNEDTKCYWIDVNVEILMESVKFFLNNKFMK